MEKADQSLMLKWTAFAICAGSIFRVLLVRVRVRHRPTSSQQKKMSSKEVQVENIDILPSYGVFNHPGKSFVDIILSILSPLVMPLRSIVTTSPQQKHHVVVNGNTSSSNGNDNDNQTATSSLQKLRLFIAASASPNYLKAWNKEVQQKGKDKGKGGNKNNSSKDFLVSGIVKVPRNSKILVGKKRVVVQDGEGESKSKSESNNIHNTTRSAEGVGIDVGGFDVNISSLFPQPHDSGPTIDIVMTCPRSALKDGTYTITGEEIDLAKKGARQIAPCELDDLKFASQDTNVLLWFHGGGFTMNSPSADATIMDLAKELSHTRNNSNVDGDDDPHPLVVLQVTYRLAPENPFPAAVIDALSAASAVLETFPSCSIHIGGLSAGANLAIVSAFERLHNNERHENLRSLVVIDPFLAPSADSESYQLNAKYNFSSLPEFLRWCWTAYLQLEEPDADPSVPATTTGDQSESSTVTPTSRSLSYESSISEYKKVLKQSKWSQIANRWPDIMRLVSPQCDIPSSLCDEKAPKIIVMTSSADSLMDEGVEFVEALQKSFATKESNSKLKNEVVHFHARGCHAFSYLTDRKSKAMFIDAFAKIIWG